MDLLAWTADPAREPDPRNLRALRVLVVGHWAVEWASWAIAPLPIPSDLPLAVTATAATWLAVCTGLAFTSRAQLACRLALPVALAGCVHVFPLVPNHTALALFVLGLLAMLRDSGEEGALLLSSLRWMAVLVFVWAGVQKLLNGLYLRGEFLTWMIAHGPAAWRSFFAAFVPAEELARVIALPRFAPDIGPYRIDSLPLWIVSNGVWVAEIALGLGLLWHRVRAWAALGALSLVITIQAAPHEWMFALFYSELLLLFFAGPWLLRLMPVVLGAYLYLLAALAGAPGASWLVKASGHL